MNKLYPILFLLLIIISLSYSSLIVSETFDNIKNNHHDKLVIFYRGETEEIKKTLQLCEDVAKTLKIEIPSFLYFKIDGAAEGSSKSYNEAGFKDGIVLFTQVADSGIQKYPLELNAELLIKHIRSLHLPITNSKLVKAFVNENDFNKAIKKGPVFMKFFTESCPHCKALKRPYQRFAQHYENIVEFMDVDCNKHSSFCGKNPVKGYPTLILFSEGKKIHFAEGDRTFITVEKFLNKHLNLEAREFNSPTVSSNSNNSEEKIEEVEGIADNNDLEEHEGQDREDHEDHDDEEKIEPAESDNTDESVDFTSDFIEDLTSAAVQSDPNDKLVLFYKGSDADAEKTITIMENVAKTIKSQNLDFKFVKVNGELAANKDFYKSGGFKGSKFFTSLKEGGIQQFQGEISVNKLVKHIESLFIEAKPELVHEFESEDSFNTTLKSKPIFLKFFIDTCVHCKNLKVPFQKFANKLQEHVTLMEINCKSNNAKDFCSKYSVRSYPTLKLFTAESNFSFDGDRSLGAIEAFLTEKANISFGGDDSELSEEEELADLKSSISGSDISVLIEEKSFADIVASQSEKVVIFYKSSGPVSLLHETLTQLNIAAAVLSQEFPDFDFEKCDGDLEVNKKEFDENGFKSGVTLFTNAKDAKFSQNITAENIIKLIRSFNLQPIPELVLPFTTELAFYDRIDSYETPRATFVKFFVDTCVHCKNFKIPFQRIAGYFKDIVDFVEINCGDESAKTLCKLTSGYPTLILFTGEKKITFEGDRNLPSIESFFAKELGIKARAVKFKVPAYPTKKSKAVPKSNTASVKAQVPKKDESIKKNSGSSGTKHDKSKLIDENNRLKNELKELEELHRILIENNDLKKRIKDLEKLIKSA